MTSDPAPRIYELVGGELDVWVEPGGAIFLRTRNRFNDPIELGERDALALADLLKTLVAELRD